MFKHLYYRECHGFWHAKFAYRGSVLGSSQVTLPPQLPLKITLDLKVSKLAQKLSTHLPNLNP